MKQPDYEALFFKSRALEDALRQDYTGEVMKGIHDYFESAKEAAARIDFQSAETESSESMGSLSEIFTACQTTLQRVWATLHPSLA